MSRKGFYGSECYCSFLRNQIGQALLSGHADQRKGCQISSERAAGHVTVAPYGCEDVTGGLSSLLSIVSAAITVLIAVMEWEQDAYITHGGYFCLSCQVEMGFHSGKSWYSI